MDVIRNERFFFQSQVEDFETQSAISVCLPIIGKIVNILSAENDLHVTLTARHQGKKLINIDLNQNCSRYKKM